MRHPVKSDSTSIRWLPLALAVSLTALFIVLVAATQGYYGGADNISHYLIARYSFRHPSLFLNAWGRPLYTLLCAPFAQFGLHGAMLLNAGLAAASAWLGCRIAKALGFGRAALAILFIGFTPMYFRMVPTVLTEVLFGFLLLLGTERFLNRRYLAAAVAWSLLPFARTEGYVLLPLFALAFLYVRKLKALPFLATGILLFTVAGMFLYRDPLWLINRFPYPVTYTHPVYHEAGSPWHFVAAHDILLGLPLEILLGLGLAGLFREIISGDDLRRRNAILAILLLVAPFAGYFILHSILFWRAMGGSLGLERVMAAVLPAAALVALKGLWVTERLPQLGQRIVTVLATLVVVATPFLLFPVPTPLSPEEETVKRSAEWLKSSPWRDHTVYYADNNVPYRLGLDPWRTDPRECCLFGDYKYLDTIPAGSLFFWDAHFGPNESKVPFDTLLCNPRQRLLAWFRPETPWITFGGGWYSVCITETVPPGRIYDNYAILDSIREGMDAAAVIKSLYINGFENPGDAWNPASRVSEPVHRGTSAYRMDGSTEFSPGLILEAAAFPDTAGGVKIRASAYVKLNEIRKDLNTLLVISLEHEGKSIFYQSASLNAEAFPAGRWRRVTAEAILPPARSPHDVLKVYVWNPGKQVFYLDDLEVVKL